MSRAFRPWGQIERLLSRTRVPNWHLIACLGPEDRSIAARALLARCTTISGETWLKIEDGPNRFSSETNARIDTNHRALLNEGVAQSNIRTFALLAPYGDYLDHLVQSVSTMGENVALDISSMPKRFFFPILRILLRQAEIKNIVAVYHVPDHHTELPISEDVQPLSTLPLFPMPLDAGRPTSVVISMGLQTLGVSELIETTGGAPIHLIFPLASRSGVRAGLTAFHRSVELYIPAQYRVRSKFLSPVDVSSAYSQMLQIVGSDRNISALAPLGPKPISLAMALLAIRRNFPVYYSQPTVYNPQYSVGLGIRDGVSACFGYFVKMAGRTLY